MGEGEARTQGAFVSGGYGRDSRGPREVRSTSWGRAEDAASRRPAEPGGPCFVSLGAVSPFEEAARRSSAETSPIVIGRCAGARKRLGTNQRGACSSQALD